MTTDITELAQSLKAAAVRVIKNYDSEWFEAGHQICTVHKSKINLISLANPVNILALLEALEKAQQRIDELLPSSENMLMPALEGLSRDHLLVTTQTAVDNYSVLHTKWLEDRQRIAELESRTVKLPKLKMLEDYLAEVAIEERKQILVGVKLEFHRECAAAGIKVEAE
ncbi:ead/Ea22-like family protein [Klebsiella variicola]|uniref:hypothetical protein n=1 Tax=Klebsiella variicola TaxID=244366 RepID=UPI002DB891AA|nr:hypothetical protein [Klebsiella variicola]MEB6445104.1 ead/Ea22-like family protein [Klebsiella variicola]